MCKLYFSALAFLFIFLSFTILTKNSTMVWYGGVNSPLVNQIYQTLDFLTICWARIFITTVYSAFQR